MRRSTYLGWAGAAFILAAVLLAVWSNREARRPVAPQPDPPVAGAPAAPAVPPPVAAAPAAPPPAPAAGEVPKPPPAAPVVPAAPPPLPVPAKSEAPPVAPPPPSSPVPATVPATIPAAPVKVEAPPVPPAAPAPVIPTFDVVRVNPKGDAVIAGRAAPDAVVTVLDGGRPVGSVTADKRGEWVLLPGEPLSPGNRELSLVARDAAGVETQSDKVVILSVPDHRAAVQAAALPPPVAVPAPVGAPASPQAASIPAAPAPAPVPVVREPVPASPPAPASSSPPVVPVETPPQAAPAKPEPPPLPVAVAVPRDGVGAAVLLQGPKPAAAGALTVDLIDYDSKGALTITGRSEAGAILQIYVDNAMVGRLEAEASGGWKLTPKEESISEGNHQLRVDRVDGAGKVMQRIELPFAKATRDLLLSDEHRVIVQPGNSLWRIARRIYGGGVQYTVIVQANPDQIKDPDLIYPGQILKLPPR